MPRAYHRICRSWDAEFARNRRLHGERIRCGPGCADCCSQLFQITEPEAALISRGIQQLAPDEAEDLRARSAAYLEERARLLGSIGSGAEEAWGSLPAPGARLACPALSSVGKCRIYPFRPLICRKFGVPLWNPDRPGRVYACELNFRSGEEIIDSELIQVQTKLHQDWKGFQRDYTAGGGHRDPSPLTVARAILEDFSALLNWEGEADDGSEEERDDHSPL